MNKNSTIINVISSLSLQLVSVISGFILPRLILNYFGSEINGMVASITQILSYITLIEGGIGSVILANLYKPLVAKRGDEVNKVISASQKFFRKIALAYVIFLAIVAIGYPFLVSSSYSWGYVFSLVLILGINIFTQYYFSISCRLLLQADQKLYISNVIKIITLILNISVILLLISFARSIHIIKLLTIIVFFVQPILLNIYVKKNYKLEKVEEDKNILKQRWNGFGHNLAYFIHTNTDIVLLTTFCSLKEVSVYSVYFLVVGGVKSFIMAISSAFSPLLGKKIAKGDNKEVKEMFNLYEFIIFNSTTVLYACCIILIVPFIKLYTNDIGDIGYIRPIFAYILIGAEALYCIRDPYISAIYAAGEFKRTQKAAYCEAIINIIISILLVQKYGLVGIALGTFCGMMFRLLHSIFFIKSFVIKRKINKAIKKILMFGLIAGISIFLSNVLFELKEESAISWIIYAIKIFVTVTMVDIIAVCIIYKEDIVKIKSVLRR